MSITIKFYGVGFGIEEFSPNKLDAALPRKKNGWTGTHTPHTLTHFWFTFWTQLEKQ